MEGCDHAANIDSNRIGQWKNAFVSPEQGSEEPGTESRGRAIPSIIVSLKAYNAVDFDDLILLPVALFQRHPAV